MAHRPEESLRFLLASSSTRSIARRYFITNGFDGALTLFGLIMGFYGSGDHVSIEVIINACLGTAIALGVSGTTSAYISETAERQKELHELESAMVTALADTAHGRASRLAPFLIAAVNGLAPMLMASIIILPLWLHASGIAFPLDPLNAALVTGSLCLFLLGIYIGRISGRFWLWAGLRTAVIAIVTSAIILILVA